MSRSFLKFILSLIIVAGITSTSFAQDDANIPHPNTKAGSAAWLFTLNGLGNFGLGGFTLGTTSNPVVAAGWKWYFSDDLALRALLGFSTNSSGDDSKSGGSKTTSTGYGIGVGVEMHTHAVYSTSPYFGAQLTFAGGGTTTSANVGGTTSESKSSGTTLGLGVLAGFDWYFTRGLAIGGEYMLGFNTTSSSTTSAGTTTDNPSSTMIGISGGGNVHLVVHF